MNINFCKYVCGFGYHPHGIFKTQDGSSYLIMNNPMYGYNSEQCTCVEIEDASDILSNPPEGWYYDSEQKNSIRFDFGNSEHAMWGIHLKSTSKCKYVVEQIMQDFNHENRVEEWKKQEKMRKQHDLIRRGLIKENDDAETDSTKLP